MMNRKHYYCMLNKPAPIHAVPSLIERAELQGWETEHVLFCGHMPVSALDIKQQGAVPVYTLIFSKWGEKDKAPALPEMNSPEKPESKLPAAAAEDAANDPVERSR